MLTALNLLIAFVLLAMLASNTCVDEITCTKRRAYCMQGHGATPLHAAMYKSYRIVVQRLKGGVFLSHGLHFMR